MFNSLLRTGRRQAIALIALFFALGGTSLAVAAGGSKSRTYYACVTKTYKTLNLTSKTGKCRAGEQKISFNSEGKRGLRGLQGRAGANGAKGEAGAAGAPGAKGETGANGAVGETGAVGAKGDAGINGTMGSKGDAGTTGARGATGSTGLQGAQGDKGDIGAPGIQGAKGDTGAPGTPGAKGDTGAPGTPGAKGDKGDQGVQGVPGQNGTGGGGTTVKDANGVTLGTLLSAGANRLVTTYFIQTPKGFQIERPVTGTFQPAQNYFTGANCTGTAYLNDGSGANASDPRAISGKYIVYSGATGGLLQMSDVDADGTAKSVKFTASTIENSACTASAGTRGGWKLKTITRSDAGLPATIKAPLTIGG